MFAAELINNLVVVFCIFFLYWTVDSIDADRKHGEKDREGGTKFLRTSLSAI